MTCDKLACCVATDRRYAPGVALALHETRVAVVEDDDDNAEMLSALLERAGAEVHRAANGNDALTMLDTVVPDVLVLDIGLPDMDGYELLSRIRARPALASTPAIAATAYAFARDRERAKAVGFAVHTAKPFDPEALVHLVARVAYESRVSLPPADEEVARLARLLDDKGVAETLKALNARTVHRYTGLYRYEGDTLRNLALADRMNPEIAKGVDAKLETTFCSLVEKGRASFVVVDGSADPRVAGLPIQPDIRSYCGALVRNADGTPFGSLCHFDHEPRAVPADELRVLEQLAPMVAKLVALEIY